MTIHVVRTDDLVGIYQPVRGPTNGDALLAENMEMFFERSEEFAACVFWWADFTEGDVSEVTAGDIHALRDIALEAARINPALTLAIVAPHDLTFGLARMFNLFVETTGWTLGSFRSTREGFAWLAKTLGRPVTPDPEAWERLDGDAADV